MYKRLESNARCVLSQCARPNTLACNCFDIPMDLRLPDFGRNQRMMSSSDHLHMFYATVGYTSCPNECVAKYGITPGRRISSMPRAHDGTAADAFVSRTGVGQIHVGGAQFRHVRCPCFIISVLWALRGSRPLPRRMAPKWLVTKPQHLPLCTSPGLQEREIKCTDWYSSIATAVHYQARSL